jgi:hypothetical protein
LFIQIDKVLMLSTGILFDFLIDFTEVLSGDGGVVATSTKTEPTPMMPMAA